MGTSRFRFSTRTLLLLALHSSLILGVIAMALRVKTMELEPLLSTARHFLHDRLSLILVLTMMCGVFAPLLCPVFLIAVFVRQCYNSVRLVSGWYFIAFTLAIPLKVLDSAPYPIGIGDWEYPTRLSIILLLTVIVSFIEARWRAPAQPSTEPLERVYGGYLPVLLHSPRRLPAHYITPVLMAVCATLFACFVICIEEVMYI